MTTIKIFVEEKEEINEVYEFIEFIKKLSETQKERLKGFLEGLNFSK